MNKIIKSNKKLQADIDKCISDLLEARKYHDYNAERYAHTKMESLMTATMQQLQCCNDALAEAKEMTINKACEWLESNVDNYETHDNGCGWYLDSSLLIEDFEKAMEEGL